MPRVLSIDIGFHNLGLVLASWSRKNEPLEVEIAKKISLETTNTSHPRMRSPT